MYVLQNVAVALSALTALVSLHTPQGSAWFWAGAACTIGIGSISSVGAQGSALSVEKEWTAVLCKGDSTALAKLNSGGCFASPETAPAGAPWKLGAVQIGYFASSVHSAHVS